MLYHWTDILYSSINIYLGHDTWNAQYKWTYYINSGKIGEMGR